MGVFHHDTQNCNTSNYNVEGGILVNVMLLWAGNTKGGSVTVLLTSCLTGLDYSVLQIRTKIVSCHTADSKPVKQEVNSTAILPPLVFPAVRQNNSFTNRTKQNEIRPRLKGRVKKIFQTFIQIFFILLFYQ